MLDCVNKTQWGHEPNSFGDQRQDVVLDFFDTKRVTFLRPRDSRGMSLEEPCVPQPCSWRAGFCEKMEAFLVHPIPIRGGNMLDQSPYRRARGLLSLDLSFSLAQTGTAISPPPDEMNSGGRAVLRQGLQPKKLPHFGRSRHIYRCYLRQKEHI